MLEAIAYKLPTRTCLQAYPGKSFIAMKTIDVSVSAHVSQKYTLIVYSVATLSARR